MPKIVSEPQARYDSKNEPLIISKSVVDRIVKAEEPGDALALYTFYYYTAKWQETNVAKAVDKYVMNGLKWGRIRLARAKAILIKYELIEVVQRRSNKGKILGWYIEVKFIWGQEASKAAKTAQIHHTTEKPQVDVTTSGIQPTNALSAVSINASNANTGILPLPNNGNGSLKKSSEEGQFAKKVYDHWNSKIYPESNGGEKYDDSKGGRDMKHLVEVVKAVKNQDPREWDKRLRRFAADEDPFLIKQGHAIHLFKWNAYSEMSMQKRLSPSTGGDVESPAYMRGQHA